MLGETLTNVRKNLGYKSARAFYHEHLRKNSSLDFNYSYYMKIEGGRIIPSPQVISSICQNLEPAAADALILSYCQTLFPQRASLFRKINFESWKSKKAEPVATTEGETLVKQSYLSLQQIDCISSSRNHYFVFLILTLARNPISEEEIQKYVNAEDCIKICAELIDAHLIKNEFGLLVSISNEMRFPKEEGPELKKIYAKIDQWNIDFPTEMPFEQQIQKMLLRRVSPRYINMIQAQSNLLIDLMRSSDEVNSDLNDDVLMFNISITKGRLPG